MSEGSFGQWRLSLRAMIVPEEFVRKRHVTITPGRIYLAITETSGDLQRRFNQFTNFFRTLPQTQKLKGPMWAENAMVKPFMSELEKEFRCTCSGGRYGGDGN
jgi:hypothetical protein